MNLFGIQFALLFYAAYGQRLVPYVNVTYAYLDTPILRALVVPYDPRNVSTTWAIEASCCGYGPFTQANVTATSVAVGGLFDLPCGRPTEPVVAEWGKSWLHYLLGRWMPPRSCRLRNDE
jgi:hypothetical protein